MKRKILCLLLAAAILSAAPAAIGYEEPLISSIVKTGEGGSAITFENADFEILPGYTLRGIVVASLPPGDSGALKFSGREVFAGEAVMAENLSLLSFVPAGEGSVSATFNFLPVYNEENAPLEQVTVGLNLTGKDNRPPVADDFSISTIKNVAIIKPFAATDPDGDALICRIVGKPKRGTAEVLPDGTLKYTPFENKTGKDTITYVAADTRGSESSIKKISVKIEKSPTKVTYSDMADSPAHYAALKLAGEGVYVGKRIGDKYYLNPRAEMTRGEFLALIEDAVGMNASSGLSTGFADDAEIGAWLKPYVVAAIKAGAIKGAPTADGRLAFLPDNPVNVAQAAVVVNALLGLSDSGVMSVAAVEDGTLPVWAAQAVSNLDESNMLAPYSAGDTLTSNLTREQAILIAYDAMTYAKDHAEKKGFFARAFGA